VIAPAPRTDGPKLRLRGVERTFRTGRGATAALGPLDLDVREGEFVCCVGPSGCGKTTLLNLVAGLEAPDRGEVIFDGRPVTGPGPDRIVIFQELGLFPWMTVLGNVEFGLKLRGVAAAERRERALRQLRLVHLTGFEQARVHELSGGMKQRVALARALAMDPVMLLMDEPFAALDAQTRDLLHQELQELWARTGTTILFVTHNVREAACLADRVVTFTVRPGRIKREFAVDAPRPRHIEDPAVGRLAVELREDLREEIEAVLAEERSRVQGG
jgi:NitT/TauT family transport system ATP-binding protein